MKIRSKLLLIFLLLALVPTGIISYVSIKNFKEILKESIGSGFVNMAIDKADWIDYVINERIADAENIAASKVVIKSIRRANRKYAKLSTGIIERSIAEIDKRWIDSKGSIGPVTAILNSDASEYLRTRQQKRPDKYGEIFTTDAMGATVAMTKPLSDYYQADEQWWIHSHGQGKGEVFLDYRGYDESIGAVALGVVVPVIDNNAVIGILKINYKVKEMLGIVSGGDAKNTLTSFLINAQGNIIVSEGNLNIEKMGDHSFEHFAGEKAGWSEDSYNGVKTIEAYARIKSRFHARVPAPGAIKGISGEKWEHSEWLIVIEAEQNTAFAPIEKIGLRILAAAALIMFFTVLLTIIIAKSLSKPLEKLTLGAAKVGAGDLDSFIDVESKNEFGTLAAAFNSMTENLRTKTVSVDRLTAEVNERITAEKSLSEALGEKEILIKEVHHRVKNNMQVISSMLNIQASAIDDEYVKYIFRENQDRIRSMSLIHEMLYKSDDLTNIDFSNYIHELSAMLFAAYKANNRQVELKKSITETNIVLDTAIPLGLIMNELVTNALNYAFPEGRKGIIHIEFYSEGDFSNFTVSDNGVGMPEEFDIERTESLGINLVKMLTRQLSGELEIYDNNGTEFRIRFPQHGAKAK